MKRIANKLHKQFAHPTPEKLIKLIRGAGNENVALEDEIKSISRKCEVCQRFRRTPSRPVVSLPLANKFNEVIAMDLKSFGNIYFLVIVDLFTRFCSAVAISNKMSGTVIKGVFKAWITSFGAPQKIMSDNGREFNSEEFQTFAEAFNIKLLNTAAESPWSNGVCEKMNGVLGRSVNKIMEDAGCDVETALAWAVSARNALSNFSGFSPNHLVFGYNPSVPNNFQNMPPALEEVDKSEVVRRNLNALHAARKDFVKIESDERIKRALRSNVRATNLGSIKEGDEVYYKRNGDERWHGPAVVTGVDGKQLMVRHGGNYHRVHICRLSKIESLSEEIVDGVAVDRMVRDKVGVSDEDARDKSISECAEEIGIEDESDDDETVVTAIESRDVESRDVESSVTESRDAGASELGAAESDVQGAISPQAGTHDSGPVDNSAQASGGGVQLLRSWKKGERFHGKDMESGEIITGKIVSRAGKSSSIHRNCYNIIRDNGWTGWYDLGQLSDLKEIPESLEMIILYNTDDVFNAKEKEIENWRKNGVYEEIEYTGQQLISTRWVVTEKQKEGKTVTKARLVARGFEEDTVSLRKDSPTCSRESVRILISVATAKKWTCNAVDVQAAYLQGNAINRDVFIKPPVEYDNGTVWKLKKTVYGLCDAARAWYLRVRDELISLKVVMCSLDNTLFMWFYDGHLEGIICIYVDDFLWAGTERFKRLVIAKLHENFLIGSSESAAFKYVGLNISSIQDGVLVDQRQYIASLETIPISKSRSFQRDSTLSDVEIDALKARIGQLNWVATNSRPDIAFDVCQLSSAWKDATVGDLLRMNKVISLVDKEELILRFPSLGDLRRCIIEVYADASFASLSDGGSQGACIVFLKDESGKRCPLYWQSRRLKRVVKSTLAAETMALLEGAEVGVYLAHILKEILMCDIKVSCLTDNKSLFDALHSTKKVDDKRLRIDIAVLLDMIKRKEVSSVSWIDTHKQLADCLTKGGASPQRLRAALSES